MPRRLRRTLKDGCLLAVGMDGQFKIKGRYFLTFQAVGSKTGYGKEETGIMNGRGTAFS